MSESVCRDIMSDQWHPHYLHLVEGLADSELLFGHSNRFYLTNIDLPQAKRCVV